MARPKIVIATAMDKTPQASFRIDVRQGMDKIEIVALLDLAILRVTTEAPDGYLDDRVAQAAVGTEPRPKLAIGTEGDGTPEERIVVKVRRGSTQVELAGLLRLAQHQAMTAGVNGFMDAGVQVAGADFLKRLVSPGAAGPNGAGGG